jgi:hypothetical protein
VRIWETGEYDDRLLRIDSGVQAQWEVAVGELDSEEKIP